MSDEKPSDIFLSPSDFDGKMEIVNVWNDTELEERYEDTDDIEVIDFDEWQNNN